jgi:hypothetical protein
MTRTEGLRRATQSRPCTLAGVTAEEAHEAFEHACADAELDPETVSFFPFPDNSGRFKAMTLRPGEKTGPDHRALLDRERWREANDKKRARVFCWMGVDPRIIGPVLRHEIEHVLQAARYDNTPPDR